MTIIHIIQSLMWIESVLLFYIWAYYTIALSGVSRRDRPNDYLIQIETIDCFFLRELKMIIEDELGWLVWKYEYHEMISSVPQWSVIVTYIKPKLFTTISEKKYPKPSSTNREKLFRMLILSTYFKVIEIDEIVHFVNNYRVLRLSNLNSHIDILMLIGR